MPKPALRHMRWHLSYRADPPARRMADRHYNRQKIGSPQFVPPGSCVVFRTEAADALWVTSAPIAEYVQHEWAGAWVNSLFRNESPHLASELIIEAVAATLAYYGDPPPLGLISFVDPSKIRSTNPGYCYLMAGFKHVGWTKGGLKAFQMLPADMPCAEPANGEQLVLLTESRERNDRVRSALKVCP